MTTTTPTHPIIDPRLAALIVPLTQEEREGLEESILEEGCRDALVVWAGRGVLVDGHHRLHICQRHDVEYSVVEVEFEDEAAVRDWMIRNALGRRNLKPRDASYLRGQLYRAQVRDRTDNLKQGSEPVAPIRQSGGSGKTTAERVAEETGVSPRTVERDAKFSETVEAIATATGVEPTEVLQLDTGACREDFEALLDLGVETLPDAQAALQQRRETRAAAKAAPPPSDPDRPFIQVTIVETVTRTCPDTGEQLVDYVELKCGHRKYYKRRVSPDRKRKSAPCYECGSGTRTPADRRRQERKLREQVLGAIRSEDRCDPLIEVIRDAMTITSLRPGDARWSAIQERIGRNLAMAGIGRAA